MSDRKPKLLDLFCGAGGCTKGYQRAGFWVRGVDHKRQPRYCGDQFIQADALEYLQGLIDSGEIEEFQAVHASPPCQAYSVMRKKYPERDYPDLYISTRLLLSTLKQPWVIENVIGSPPGPSIILCGQSFGIGTYRHRRFESNIALLAMAHSAHSIKSVRQGYGAYNGEMMSVTGDLNSQKFFDSAKTAMGIDWMGRKELSQAIPPIYTEFIGQQLMAALSAKEKQDAL